MRRLGTCRPVGQASRMAKTTTTRARPGEIVVVQPPPAPIAKRRRSGGGGFRRTKKKSRRRAGTSKGSLKSTMIGVGIGGFGVGFIEKQFGAHLPTLPLVGRKGAIALGCYFFGGNNTLVRDIGIAAAAISGYELGKTGAISGSVMGADGLAAQI